MEKKISINMADDELVSIEVDGVQYASPDEIPDAEDRARVEAMLAMPSADDEDEDEDEDDFEPPFDQAAFDKEFAEIQLENSKFPTLFVTIFLAVAVILLLVAAFSAVQALRTTTTEQPAPGRVVDLIERRSVDNQTGATRVYSYPVVEFSLPGGASQRVELSDGSWPPAYQGGEAVTVLYDPARPDQARIQSASSTLLLWLLPGITGTVGLVFLAVALLVIKAHRAQVRPPADAVIAEV
jgi:hypothetical protein